MIPTPNQKKQCKLFALCVFFELNHFYERLVSSEAAGTVSGLTKYTDEPGAPSSTGGCAGGGAAATGGVGGTGVAKEIGTVAAVAGGCHGGS